MTLREMLPELSEGQWHMIERLLKEARINELLLMRQMGDEYVAQDPELISFEGLSHAYDQHCLRRLADLTGPAMPELTREVGDERSNNN